MKPLLHPGWLRRQNSLSNKSKPIWLQGTAEAESIDWDAELKDVTHTPSKLGDEGGKGGGENSSHRGRICTIHKMVMRDCVQNVNVHACICREREREQICGRVYTKLYRVMHVCTYTCIHDAYHDITYVRMQLYRYYIYECIYIYVCVCVCVCVSVCMYVQTHIHKDISYRLLHMICVYIYAYI
jgi:hypothetical protein